VGLLQVEGHAPNAHSQKDKRAVLKSLKDQLRGRFNVAVAEVNANDTWQRATLGVSTLGDDRAYVAGLLGEVTQWLRSTRLVDLIRVEEEYW
jgi:uncharacterized protein YlxP (DUF503 family)